jgi:hypothetical protein
MGALGLRVRATHMLVCWRSHNGVIAASHQVSVDLKTETASSCDQQPEADLEKEVTSMRYVPRCWIIVVIVYGEITVVLLVPI